MPDCSRRLPKLCFICCLILATKVDATQPNILFIYLDDYGWKDAGYLGSDFFETPHLDRLAAESMIFTDAYSCAANCAPARACLLSGQYTPRHRVFNVGTRPRGNAKHRRLQIVPGVSTLDPSIKTWAQCIQEAGYKTGHFGKWHLSKDPLPYGFDVNVGGTHSGSPPDGYYPPHNVPGLRNAPKEEYLTDRLSAEVVHFIRENRQRPWLAYLSHFAVHTPLHAKNELVSKYKNKPAGTLHSHVAMATMIEAVDSGVGQILEAVKSLQLEEQTIVIFYSDNGGYAGATDMQPLRGYKGTYYEGGIRVPLFVKWPSAGRAGRSSEPITGVDLYPTLCAMAEAQLPTKQILDGENLVPLLTGRSDELPDRAIYWHFPAYLQANGKWASESRDSLFRTRPCSIIRHGDWKLHHYFEDDAVELYNLRDDIGEDHDLADSKPEVTTRLLAELNHWRAKTDAPLPTTPNPLFDAEAERTARLR